MKKSRILSTILVSACVAAVFSSQSASAQCLFTSGSTGTNGDFIPLSSMPSTGWSANGNVVTVTNSADGVFHFGTVYIETNWIVQFTKNTLNTPVYLLASNNVTINGAIDVSGFGGDTTTGGTGGPGGFDGGRPTGEYGPGFGPGGGAGEGGGGGFATRGEGGLGGLAYGVIDIQPFVGGSGGAGNYYGDYAYGGGGGGAILIASSGTITINGSVLANGEPAGGDSGTGSGGAIRLIGRTFTGEGSLSAIGSSINGASIGRIRVEACTITRQRLTSPPFTTGQPGDVFLATNPTIRVTSVAGVNTPSVPTGSLTNPDTNLPSSFTNSTASISVSANNIPPGTPFKIIVTPVWGTNMIASNTLAGTYSVSTGVVDVAVYTDRPWRVNALIDYIPRP